MMRDGNQNAFTRQVHFANGFPPKGLLQAASPFSGSPYTNGGHFVSLGEVSPRVGRIHRSIPPLAKGRGQFCSMRDRPEDERYRRRPDPFKLPKAAGKTGFSASQIKRAKPRVMRACRSTEPPPPPPATAAFYNLNNLTGTAVYSTPPNRPLDSDFEDDIVSPSVELKSKNSRIISDVEKESIQAELAGLEEVYQRVCHGKIESLYSLLYPSQKDMKRGLVQYINTSAPVQLRTPKFTQNTKKFANKGKDTATTPAALSHAEKARDDKNGQMLSPGPEDESKEENSTRPILIPLPYIRSEISVTTPGKQQKPIYNVPYIYSNRTNKGTSRHSHNNTSPAVINFSSMNIPELSRPGIKTGVPVGPKGSALNSGVAEAPMHWSIPTPYFSSSGPFQRTTPNQMPALFDDADVEEKLGKLDIESVGSDIDYTAQQKTIEGSVGANNALPGNLVLNEENSDKKAAEDVMAKGIRFSLTTDVGLVEGVEIYDYDKRDVQSEQEAAKHIQEMEEIGEKKLKEYAELLEEHQHILDEVKQLEKDLHESHE